MNQVSQNIIDCMHKAYSHEWAWLQEAKMDSSDREHPICYGRFRVPAKTYTREPQIYLGCPEAVACVNQLAYVAWAQILEEKLVDANMDLENFLSLPSGNMNMIDTERFEIERLRFKRAIRKDADFWGKMTLDSYRPGDLTIVIAKYDFEDRALIGKGMFLISKNNSKI